MPLGMEREGSNEKHSQRRRPRYDLNQSEAHLTIELIASCNNKIPMIA